MENLFILETDHPKAHFIQYVSSILISLYLPVFCMITSINLDYQLSIQANEINYVRSDNVLAIEFLPQLAIPYSTPQQPFRLCGMVSILFGIFSQ